MNPKELRSIVMTTDDWLIVCSCLGAFYVNLPTEETKEAKRVLTSLTRQVMMDDQKAKVMIDDLEKLRMEMHK